MGMIVSPLFKSTTGTHSRIIQYKQVGLELCSNNLISGHHPQWLAFILTLGLIGFFFRRLVLLPYNIAEIHCCVKLMIRKIHEHRTQHGLVVDVDGYMARCHNKGGILHNIG